MKLLVVLTQWKRKHLELQLKSIYSQTLKPDYVVVFQNENHRKCGTGMSSTSSRIYYFIPKF